MKRFSVNVIDEKVVKAAEIAEALLTENSKMMLELSQKSDWKYKPVLYGKELVEQLCEPRDTIPVFTYKPFYWRSSVIGYFDGKAIYVNLRKLPTMTVEDVASNLLHEYCHYAGFSHGNKYKTHDKVLYSVPYFVSENFKRWL